MCSIARTCIICSSWKTLVFCAENRIIKLEHIMQILRLERPQTQKSSTMITTHLVRTRHVTWPFFVTIVWISHDFGSVPNWPASLRISPMKPPCQPKFNKNCSGCIRFTLNKLGYLWYTVSFRFLAFHLSMHMGRFFDRILH